MNVTMLSDQNVTDLTLRAQMYRDIKEFAATDDSNITLHTIKPDEAYRSDLVSFRVYNRSDLAWLVDLIADREDIALPLVASSTVRLPDAVYIRGKIKEYTLLESEIS